MLVTFFVCPNLVQLPTFMTLCSLKLWATAMTIHWDIRMSRLLMASWPEEGHLGDVSRKCWNHLFRDPPCLFPPLTWVANLCFSLMGCRNFNNWWGSRTRPLEQLLGKLFFWAQHAIWAFCWLILKCVWSWEPFYKHWFVLLSILPTGSDFCLCWGHLSAWLSLGISANVGCQHVSTIEGYWCWRNTCLELRTGHPLSWFRMSCLLWGMCTCFGGFCEIGKFRFKSDKENLAMIVWLTERKKDGFFN